MVAWQHILLQIQCLNLLLSLKKILNSQAFLIKLLDLLVAILLKLQRCSLVRMEKKYTSYGTYQHPSDPWGALVQVGVDEHVTKFVRFRFSEPGYKIYGPQYDTPLVSELRVYANE